MKLKSLNLVNYKSIESCNLEFNNKTIILGANASGKSNLISSLKFINYILMYGIDDAVSLMGGIDNLININSNNEFLEIGFSISLDNDEWYRKFDKTYNSTPTQMDYTFKLMKMKKNQFKVLYDNMKIVFALYENSRRKEKETNYRAGEFSIEFIRDGRKFTSSIVDNKTQFTEANLMKEEIYK